MEEEFNNDRTLWQGQLENWMDEHFIQNTWLSLGHQVTVRIIRNKATMISQGYCFIQFQTPDEAKTCLDQYNGHVVRINHVTYTIRLNTALGGSKPGEVIYSLFVGDLGREVNDQTLLSAFSEKFITIKSAKVVMDPMTGNSRGYGFVRFTDEYEYLRALNDMQGVYIGSRQIRVSSASHQKANQASGIDPQAIDTPNMKIFVTGLTGNATEADLTKLFAPFGDLASIKILPGKGCGFVHYVHSSCAEQAMTNLQGKTLQGQTLKLTWSRTTEKTKPTTTQMPIVPNPMAQMPAFTNPYPANVYDPSLYGAGYVLPTQFYDPHAQQFGDQYQNLYQMQYQNAYQNYYQTPQTQATQTTQTQPAAQTQPVVNNTNSVQSHQAADPLDAISVDEENKHFVSPRQDVMSSLDSKFWISSSFLPQNVPLPSPLLS